MTPFQLPAALHVANFQTLDPGDGNPIVVDRWNQIIPLHIAASASETNTLADPVKSGLRLTLVAASVGSGGSRVVTVASAYDQAGGTTLTFDAADERVILESVDIGTAALSSFAWRVVDFEGVTGPTQDIGALEIGGTAVTATAAELNILDGVTATAAELNSVADASARVVNATAGDTAIALTAAAHAERCLVVPVITSAGLTITLPAATGTGNRYKVINNGTQTVALTITALAGDLLNGIAKGWSLTAGANDTFVPDGTDDIKYTFNLTTSGGDGGDTAEFIDLATDLWFADITFHGSGTLATGFA